MPPQVTLTVPAAGVNDLGTSVKPRAKLSRPLDPTTVTATTFTLTGPAGQVAATVAYDSTTQSATLTPNSPLALGTTYTARLDPAIKATDGSPLGTAFTWTFSTAATTPAALAVASTSPVDGATTVLRDSPVKATFSRSIDPDTLTTSSFTLTGPSGPVPTTVTYDPATLTATLTPTTQLASDVSYTARIDGTIKAADGTLISSAFTWTWMFSTSTCPCQLFSNTLVPALLNLPVQDGRGGSGPFSYELGVKVQFSQPVKLNAIRFWKDTQETGAHVGRVWTALGTQLGSVTFASETSSGWQQQAFAAPIALDANTVYTISVNINAAFVVTGGGLATQIVSGPAMSVADGQNGVFGSSAGTFPTQSANSSNYFVDVSVTPNGAAPPLTVSSTIPAANATGVLANATVKATFSGAVNPATVTTSNVTLKDPSGASVASTVSFDNTTNTATLTPSAPLATSTAYTATVSTGVHSADGTPMASAYSWSFTTKSAPSTTIASGPATTTGATSATFAFSSADTTVASFQCALDGAAFATCTSPQNYTALAVGSHNFQVRAIDQAAVTGPATSYPWTIVTTPTASITS